MPSVVLAPAMWPEYAAMKEKEIMIRASTDERRRSFVLDVAGGAMGLLIAACAGTSGATPHDA